jgi:hypothetical protein
MKILRTASEEAILASFAESEFSSARHRDDAASWIQSETARTRILSTHPTEWSVGDRALAIEAIRGYRQPILGGLFALKPSWHVAEISQDELASLRPLDFAPFNALAPDRRLGTLVGAMDAGRDTPNDGFAFGYRSLKKTFRVEAVLGLPAVAAKTKGGPFVVFDGLTRLCVLCSRVGSGETIPTPIPLFVALTPRLSEWRWAGL